MLAKNLKWQALINKPILNFLCFFTIKLIKTGFMPKEEIAFNKNIKAIRQFKTPKFSGPKYLARKIDNKMFKEALNNLSNKSQDN